MTCDLETNISSKGCSFWVSLCDILQIQSTTKNWDLLLTYFLTCIGDAPLFCGTAFLGQLTFCEFWLLHFLARVVSQENDTNNDKGNSNWLIYLTNIFYN